MPRVTMLGCGGSAGVPQIGGKDGFGDWGACDPAEARNRRTRSSIVIEADGKRLLVDASPDLRLQLVGCGIAALDAILFTHGHADHIMGVDDLRIVNRVIGRPLDCYATARTLSELDRRFDYAFLPHTTNYFYRPVLVPHEIGSNGSVQAGGIPVQVFEQDHGSMPSLGLRVGAFGYSTDVVRLDEAALTALEGVDTWIVDCFQRRGHTTHANLDQVLAWVDRLKPRRTVLTHMGYDLDWSWLQQRLPAGVEPGWDGMVLDVPGA